MINRRSLLWLLGLAPIASGAMPVVAAEPEATPTEQAAQLPSSLTITNGRSSVVINLPYPAWVEFKLNGHTERVMPFGEYEIHRDFSDEDWFRVDCFSLDGAGHRSHVNFEVTTEPAA